MNKAAEQILPILIAEVGIPLARLLVRWLERVLAENRDDDAMALGIDDVVADVERHHPEWLGEVKASYVFDRAKLLAADLGQAPSDSKIRRLIEIAVAGKEG